MGKFKAEEKSDGTIKIGKGYEKLSEENAELAQELDYITKEELISAIHKLASKIGVTVEFTYENKKNEI